jgi:Tol biopolymer transport system component
MVREVEIEAQLRRILESSIFVGAARSRQFLEFCISRAMRGEANQLKETTIAVEVFLRPADYDPKIDPIVRVHARRLREKLELYYRTTGADDPIKIEIPKGGYVPQILRTLPKRKSEFTEWNLGVTKEKTDPVPIAPVLPPRKNHHLQIVCVLLAVCLTGFIAAWIWRGQTRAEAKSFNALSPLDAFTEDASDPAWSANGQWLAATVTPHGDDKPHIYIQNVRNGAPPVRLTQETSSETRPVFSPDGREIAFTRRIDLSHFEIVRCDLASKKLTVVGKFISYWPIPDDHPTLDWSPDGRFLLTAEQAAANNPMRLVLITVATGERVSITSPPAGSSGDIEAKFSPDGQWIAFRRGGLGDLYLVSVQGEQVKPAARLTFDTKGVRGITWIDNGRSILYGTQRSDTEAYALWKIARDGGTPQPVTPPEFDAVNPAISSTGSLVFAHRQLVTELVEKTVGQGNSTRLVLPSEKTDSSPAYSPDGSSIAFVSTRTGWGELWLYREGDAAPVQLTHFRGEGIVFPPSWAPGEHSLAFGFRKNGATNIMVYDLDRHTMRSLTQSRNREFSPIYSSDGRYIYYSSNDDGTSRIWRIRSDGSAHPEPLFVEVASSFLPSPDGRWLYFLQQGTELVLMRRSLIDGTTEEVFHTKGHTSFVNSLAARGQSVYVAVSQNDFSSSEIFEVIPGQRGSRVVALLKNLPPLSVSGIAGFSVSPDGRRIIVDRTRHHLSSLYSVSQGLTMPAHS